MPFDPHALIDWTLSPEARGADFPTFFEALLRKLQGLGIRLARAHVGTHTMHPEVFVLSYRWWHDEPSVLTETMPHSRAASSAVTKSPILMLYQNDGRPFRVDLEVPADEIAYPLCREIKARGGTEYVAFLLPTAGGVPNVCSFSSLAPGGFTPDERAAIEALLPALALRVELEMTVHAQRTLLRTYLGNNAAERVLAGAFQRGSGQRIEAAIWMSDLRGFTERVDQNPLPVVLDALNAYFSCVADAITEQGGEVLKFIGDAVLAVFPLGAHPRAACRSALDAAEKSFAAMAAANDKRRGLGLDDLRYGVVLHLGEVMYGNIGSDARLDFTVIGAAVNEASRVESLCKTLGAPLLLTEQFVAIAEDERAVSLGRHPLRGVSHAPEIFTHAKLMPQ